MRVAIIGAGPSGLVAARELNRAGIEVVIFEGEEKVGGRIDSRYDEAGSFKYEAGAEWIDADHTELLKLCDEFGLELVSSAGDQRGVFYLDELIPESELWPDARRAMDRVLEEATKIVESGKEPDVDKTLLEFVGPLCDTPRAQMWVNAFLLSDEGAMLNQVSLAGWIHSIRPYLTRGEDAMSAFRVKEGLSKVIQGLAVGLEEKVRFNKQIHKFEELADGVVITDQDDVLEKFDGVIHTGFAILSKTEFIGPCESYIANALEYVHFATALKLVFEFESNWRANQPYAGFWHLGSPLCQTWFPASDCPALLAYVVGKSGIFWHDVEDDELQDVAVTYIEKFFPDAPKVTKVERVFEPKLSVGAFSVYAPGVPVLARRALAAYNGRMLFAGEGMAEYPGFVESAVRSGMEAARKMIRKANG
jgi:monoamine oxidase